MSNQEKPYRENSHAPGLRHRPDGFLRLQLFKLVLGLVCALPILCPSPSSAQQLHTSREYKLKVAYLYNFTRYVTWPKEAFESPKSPFVIGILGSDPLGKAIDSVARTKKVGGRTLVVKRFASEGEYTPCHILFVSGAVQNSNHDAALRVAEGKPVLIVGEAQGFAARGGTVSFFDDTNGTVGFEINIDATKRQMITFQAPVLKLANIVHDAPGRMVSKR